MSFVSNRLAGRMLVCGLLLAALVLPSDASAKGGGYTVLYNFKDKSDGATPSGVLYADAAGNLYGMALLGESKIAWAGIAAAV